MSRWIFQLLLTLSLAIVMIPCVQRIVGKSGRNGRAPGACAGGGCGNLRQLQETLDRNTIRFRQPLNVHTDDISP